jgi:hypothetical protein
MRRIGFRRPSPSMMIASVALLVALGGTSYAAIQLPANSVGTKQLKKNAVVSKKVKNRSLKAVDFALGQLPAGPQGLQGAQGPAGPQGPKGEKGDPAPTPTITVRTGAEATTDASANCEAGEVALGGGGTTDGFLYDSGPNVGSGIPSGWLASARNADDSDATVQAFVVCAAP